MCDMGLTAMAMSAASQAAAVLGQKQQAEAQAAAQKEASIQEMRRFQLSQRAERQRQADEETATSLERQKAVLEETEGVATTITAAEESGVSGNSVGLAIAEFARKNAEYQSALSLQERMNETAQRLAFENAGNAYINQMTAINKPIEQPNYLGAVLGIGQTIAGGYAQYKQGQDMKIIRNKQGLLIDAQLKNAQQSVAASQQAYQNAAASYGAASMGTNIQRERAKIQSTQLYGAQ